LIAVRDAASWARELGISEHALALYRDSEVIDLHLDSFIWHRLLGYRIGERHARPPLAGWHLGHADFARAREAGLSAATWVITTNPLREAHERFTTLLENIRNLSAEVTAFGDDLTLARTYSDYRAARARGSHAVFLGVQGGNALIEPPDSIERLPPLALLRVTLMHLTNSRIGATSSPLRWLTTPGLTPFGRDFVARLNAANILVDLAHIDRQGFWDALDVQAPHVPAIVTHTGVAGARSHWRNLDDAQLRAIAETGGVVGILFHSSFIASNWFTARAEHVVEHLAHVVRVAGEDTPALGSDFDGNIIPPRDLLSVLDLPRLVELMLQRGFSEASIRKILGQNFLRVLAQTRP
jgi:membrane dipeptidase